MSKKIVVLKEEELNRLIGECVRKALNEIDGKTLSIVPNVSIDAKNNIQNGNYDKRINDKKTVTYDSQIVKADKLYPRALQSFIAPYTGFPFMFFAFRRVGNAVHFIFEIEQIKKLLDGEAILGGSVTFGDTQLNGDIVVDLINDKVYYKHKLDRHKYLLTPDNRTASKWNELLNNIKIALSNRIERG